jgi:hypothetical protein
MSRLGKLLRTATSKASLPSVPVKNRKAILQEAARWLDILQDAGASERASCMDWIYESPQHLEAFLLVEALDPALREIGADRLRQAVLRQRGLERQVGESATEGAALTDKSVSAAKWENLKSNPLVITAGAVIFAVGVTWAVANEVMVKPREQQLEQLKSQLLSRRDSTPDAAANKQSPGTGKHASRHAGVSEGDQTQHPKAEDASTPPQ